MAGGIRYFNGAPTRKGEEGVAFQVAPCQRRSAVDSRDLRANALQSWIEIKAVARTKSH